MKRFLTIAVILAALHRPVAAAPRLLAGVERPVTSVEQFVPFPSVGETALVAPAGKEFAFWWDQRLGGRMFRSVAPFDGPYPSGAPFEPFRGFLPYGAIEIAQVGSGYLMIVEGKESGPAAPARVGFYALPLDSDGEPLADRPVRIWDSQGDAHIKLLSNGDTALLLWSEQYSVRTLQLGADGRLLEWSAPVESLAGTIRRFDATVVGSSYLLLVAAYAGDAEGRLDGYAVPLMSDGDPSAPLTPVMQPSEWQFDLVGGPDTAFVVWYSGEWRGAVLSPDGRTLHEMPYPALGSDPWFARSKVTRRHGGWTLVSSRVEQPYGIDLIDLDASGSIVGVRTITLDAERPTGLIDTGESDTSAFILGVRKPDEQASATWFVDATEGVPLRRARISSMEAQHAAGIEASRSDLLLLWTTTSDYCFNRAHVRLLSQPESLDLPLDNYGRMPAVASDGERFLLLQFSDPSTVYGRTLAGRRIDAAGAVSEPFAIAPEVFTRPVVAWSGTEFLVFWTRSATFKLTLTSGEMFVSSVFPSGAVQSSSFALRWTMQEDAICGDPGCFVIWNDADLTQYCDFCVVPTRLLGAPTLRSGERPSDPIVLDDVGREAQLAALGTNIALVELVPGKELRVRELSWSGTELARVSITEIAASPRFAVASLGENAVVVWEQDGDLVGRVVTPGGMLGAVFPVADSPEEEARPFLAVRGDTVTVVYDRLTPEAGWVPRGYVRELTLCPERRRGVRP
jgi:hypothetical protein